MVIDKELLKSGAADFSVILGSEALDRFEKYAELLIETNKEVNLTSITEPNDIVIKHFVDSLSLLSAIELKEKATIIDVGTGAGFPGIALLIARPDLSITLLDSTKKKLSFIEQVLNELELTASTCHMRAEDAGKNPRYRESFDFAVARAVSNMRELSEYCLPFVKLGGEFIAMKGARAEDELSEARHAIKTLGGSVEGIKTFTLGEFGDRGLILLKKISQTPTKYPRCSAQIATKRL